jgi:hypothetical protein
MLRAVRSLALAWLLVVTALAPACDKAEARPLVLLDGSPDAAHAELDARAREFSRKGRAVQVLKVDAARAVELAARGEGEVCVVGAGAPLGDLVSSGRGREAGTLSAGGVPLVVLEVDGRLHPKVDGPGAHALAAFLGEGPR